MTITILPDKASMNADIYTQESSAFCTALRAIRRSRYPLDVRVQYYRLLDERLGQTCNPADAERFSTTCLRVALFFQRRAF